MPKINNILVLRAKITSQFEYDGYTWEWIKVTPFRHIQRGYVYWVTRQAVITERKAKEMIDKFGLALAHKDVNGEIYNTPDKAFQNTFKGKIQIPTL